MSVNIRPTGASNAQTKKENVDTSSVQLHRFNFNITPTTITAQNKLGNGGQAMDLIQDIINTKLNNFSHQSPVAKQEKIRLMIENSVSEKSRTRVQEIFSQLEQFKPEEKLLLYLKLPMSLTNINGNVDPLRQPLNPLGNRSEIHQTIMWIKTHLEEDPGVSLPKQDVYDEYNHFCAKNSMKPLSTADFGKVMKQVYPGVKPRRLGTRGNSRYCYAGMRKKLKLEAPKLPEDEDANDMDFKEEMLGAASSLIREWAQNVLNLQFPTLASLAKYLVNNFFVDAQSLAAVCITSSTHEPKQLMENQGPNTSSGKVKGISQKKLQSKETPVDLKNCTTQNQRKTPNADGRSSNKRAKKNKCSIGSQLTESTNTLSTINSGVHNIPCQQVKMNNKINKNHCSIDNNLQSNCDNLGLQSAQSDESNDVHTPRALLSAKSNSSVENSDPSFEATNKSSCRKRSTNNTPAPASESSPEKQFKLIGDDSQTPDKIAIFASDLYFAKTDGTNASKNCDNNKSFPTKISGVDSETLNEYLNGSNSQEQEEELLQYFQQHNSLNLKKSEPKPPPANNAVIHEKFTHVLPNLLHGTILSAKRRVSFDSVVPQSPNTRRRIFNFTPISPGPQSPATAESPFISPRNTPVPRSRSSNLQGQQFRARNRTISRSISCNVPSNHDQVFVAPPSVFVDLPSQESPLVISYPSQENLQEIKTNYNCHQQSMATDPQYRSQSVPLHQMVNPALLSPIPGNSFPTPVPSELNDFCSIGDNSCSSVYFEDDQQFLLDIQDQFNNSRSYPSTPVPVAGGPAPYPCVNYQQPDQDKRPELVNDGADYSRNEEPMLFNPSAVVVRDTRVNANCANNVVECNVSDLLNPDDDDLNPLGHFEGLHDVDALTPLFNEVVESNN